MTATPEAPTVSVGDYTYQLSSLVEAFNTELARLRQAADQPGGQDTNFQTQVEAYLQTALRGHDEIRELISCALVGGMDDTSACRVLMALTSRGSRVNGDHALQSTGGFTQDIGTPTLWVAQQLVRAISPLSDFRLSSTFSDRIRDAYPDASRPSGDPSMLTTRDAVKMALRPIIQELVAEVGFTFHPNSSVATVTPAESADTDSTEEATQTRPTPEGIEGAWSVMDDAMQEALLRQRPDAVAYNTTTGTNPFLVDSGNPDW